MVNKLNNPKIKQNFLSNHEPCVSISKLDGRGNGYHLLDH